MTRWQLAAALYLATAGSSLEARSPFLTGSWGGPHVAMAFSGGLADVRFDCASGSIDALVIPAKDGAFVANGTYRMGAPGPVRVGQIFISQPATYSGNVTKVVSGKVTNYVMTLNVELEDGTQVGPFTLTEGAAPQLTRCL